MARRLVQISSVALVILGFLMVAEEARTQQASFQVVANPSLEMSTIGKKDLARIFLKQKKAWPNGAAAVPVDQKLSAAVRTEFSTAILRKGAKAVESYWNGQVFAGKASPPQTMGSDVEVLNFVRTTPGAVGYVSASAPTSGVIVLRIDG